MNLLAVDATSDALTVALDAGGRVLRARRSGRRPHDETLLPAVESVLKRARLKWDDIDAVAAASGPGRFTGIRIGLSFAAAVALKRRVPALALSRLEAAAERSDAKRVVGAVPGWKGEVYHQAFRRAKRGLVPDGDARWTSADEWPGARAAAEKDAAVELRDTDAADLLPVARRRLAAKSAPPLKPFYLKPAGYEKKPGR